MKYALVSGRLGPQSHLSLDVYLRQASGHDGSLVDFAMGLDC